MKAKPHETAHKPAPEVDRVAEVAPDVVEELKPIHEPTHVEPEQDAPQDSPVVEPSEITKTQLLSQPKRVVANTDGVHHGGHMIQRADGSGVFFATSYEGHTPQFRRTHDENGMIHFKDLSDLMTKVGVV